MPKHMTKAQANKAHRDMMSGLRKEYQAGVLTKTEYDKLRKRAVQLHKLDIAALASR